MLSFQACFFSPPTLSGKHVDKVRKTFQTNNPMEYPLTELWLGNNGAWLSPLWEIPQKLLILLVDANAWTIKVHFYNLFFFRLEGSILQFIIS